MNVEAGGVTTDSISPGERRQRAGGIRATNGYTRNLLCGVDGCEFGYDVDRTSEADFLLGLTERRLERRCIPALALAARQAELPPMKAGRCTHHEHDSQLGVRIPEDGHADGGLRPHGAP
jgi:hypothetical protein